jgi:hypothetical protein
VALISQVVNSTYDGCTLTEVYDDTTYDAASDSYSITSLSASNPTGGNGFPARTLTVWAIYKGSRVSTTVAPGQTKSQTFPGGRSIADVTSFGLS